MKIFKRICLGTFLLLGMSIIGIILTYQLNPKPMSYLVRKQFDTSDKKQIYPRPTNYEAMTKNVSILENQEYKSDYNNHTMDIYLPKRLNKKVPILFWMHGGAYVGGDKRDVKDYLEMLSSRTGIIVVNINYALAPESKYPTPVKQLNEAIKMIQGKKELNIDWGNIYLGGDSAGAQITSEYLISLLDSKVAKYDGFTPVVKSTQIKKYISLSGLLEPTNFSKVPDKFSSIMFKSCGWSYFGHKNFENLNVLQRIQLMNYSSQFSQEFFLTDGNSGSFTNQMESLSEVLNQKKVAVTQVSYNKSVAELGHEYQFDFSIKQANETFEKLIKFILVN